VCSFGVEQEIDVAAQMIEAGDRARGIAGGLGDDERALDDRLRMQREVARGGFVAEPRACMAAKMSASSVCAWPEMLASHAARIAG
jgi:hypothetical protein